jgi:uncharacterized protein
MAKDFSRMEDSNRSSNPSIHEVSLPQRRTLLQGGLAAASATLLAPLAGCAAGGSGSGPLLGFKSVPVSTADTVTVPEGYVAQVLAPWGEPVGLSGENPAFKFDASNTAAEQEVQMGMHHDGIHFFKHPLLPDTSNAGLQVMNHEYAGHALLRTAADPRGVRPLGTVNNCGSGITPWGTYLTCEENFIFYFKGPDTPSAHEARWGLRKGDPVGYRWHEHDERFDAAKHPNEPNRFGWIVEIDPANPSSTPIKRTALGRAAHEGATVAVTQSGRAVVYSGEDARFEYIYKFVSRDRIQPGGAAANAQLLDHGTLYVARFDANGTGRWLALTHGSGPLTAANGFADPGEVLIKTRQASDALGATKMDRPEWIDGTTFRWNHFVLAGDPTLERADAKGNIKGDAFACPDGLWTDARGVLWIQTDMSTSAMGRGDLTNLGHNCMLAADPRTGDIRRFLTGPAGCEVTGATATPDGRTMFINIQHPGESPSERNDPAAPRRISNWPDQRADGRPRSATVVITRRDGGLIGT